MNATITRPCLCVTPLPRIPPALLPFLASWDIRPNSDEAPSGELSSRGREGRQRASERARESAVGAVWFNQAGGTRPVEPDRWDQTGGTRPVEPDWWNQTGGTRRRWNQTCTAPASEGFPRRGRAMPEADADSRNLTLDIATAEPSRSDLLD